MLNIGKKVSHGGKFKAQRGPKKNFARGQTLAVRESLRWGDGVKLWACAEREEGLFTCPRVFGVAPTEV